MATRKTREQVIADLERKLEEARNKVDAGVESEIEKNNGLIKASEARVAKELDKQNVLNLRNEELKAKVKPADAATFSASDAEQV